MTSAVIILTVIVAAPAIITTITTTTTTIATTTPTTTPTTSTTTTRTSAKSTTTIAASAWLPLIVSILARSFLTKIILSLRPKIRFLSIFTLQLSVISLRYLSFHLPQVFLFYA
ncbi:hypothetical protein B9Z19DRAFT_1069884 [Tuber borchii]|uniref:Uncharacterized protein n=1 Tax=Tuber borchii TaxID=42251 RepID=A0A2T6Z9Z2_TUBBO|nr:hypothetical protein B9Z19DRAFT_1069884 [Tuber borchii]